MCTKKNSDFLAQMKRFERGRMHAVDLDFYTQIKIKKLEFQAKEMKFTLLYYSEFKGFI